MLAAMLPPTVPSVFVGRQRELARLDEVARRVRDDRVGGAALIVGDPGSGKSRLLGEALSGAAIRRQVRLVGFEPTQSIPLAAAGDLLRRLSGVPVHGRRLEELAFGATEGVPDPVRIFEAAHRALSVSGPLLVAVDDLHWLDDLTIGLLLYLLRAAVTATTGVAIIAAARPSPITAAFRGAMEAALADAKGAVLELGPLSLSEGLALARSLDQGLDDAAAAAIWRRAAGSPFWLEALAVTREPSDLTTLIDNRLQSIGADAGRLIAALAVAARPYAVDQLGEVLDWESGRVQAVTRELEARGLGLEGGGYVRTAHDLIREAAEREIPSSLRRRLHARFAQLIEADAGDDVALLREALEHRAAAGLPSTDLALRLAASPQRRLLGRDGLLLLVAISDSLPVRSPAQLALDQRLGEIADSLGEQDVAIERWARVADAAGRPDDRVRALIEAGWSSFRRRDAAAVHAFADRARAVLGPPVDGAVELEPVVRLEALEALTALWLDHRTAEGAMAADRALDAARRMWAAMTPTSGSLSRSARLAYLAALEAAMDAALQQDRPDEVARLGDESLAIASGRDSEARVAALNRFAFALRALGHSADAEVHSREAWELASHLVLPAAQVEAGHGLAQCLATMGRLEAARDAARATAEIEARLRHVAQRWGNAVAALHGIELSMGDPTLALRALGDDAARETDPHFRLGIHQTIALWEARWHGSRAAGAVEDELAAAQADWALVGCPRCGRELAIRTVEALARIGQPDRAREGLTAWDERADGASAQAATWRLGAEAMLRAAEGDRSAARGLLETLGTRLEVAGEVDEALWARIDLGRVLLGNDRQAAMEVFTAAESLAEDMGARSEARLIAQALRRLGVRAWRRRGSVGEAALSAREVEVARLVATGASNREISEALVIAPKTVERHVSNALTKLGLRNRTELAAAMTGSQAPEPG